MYLLGAKEIIATDVHRIAYPQSLYKAIHSSNLQRVLDVLTPFEDRDLIKSRLERLEKTRSFSFETLRDLKIRYVAPVDLAVNPLGKPFDFVYSNVVLEHIPRKDVLPIFQNLASDLAGDGIMIHSVHLEDHKDNEKAPFDFFKEPAESFTRDLQSIRGNRIRPSEWKEILSNVKDMEFVFIFQGCRNDCTLPANIDVSISYNGEADLRSSGLGILGRKIVSFR